MKKIEELLSEWKNKHIDDLSITELSILQYVLEHLPAGVTYTIGTDKGIEEYIEEIRKGTITCEGINIEEIKKDQVLVFLL